MRFEIEGDVLIKCKPEEHELDKPIVVPPDVRVIGTSAFAKLPMKHVILPESTEIIRSHAFSPCWHLEEIRIPSRVHTIGNSAFYNCARMKRIFVPDTVRRCGVHVLSMCVSMKSIWIYRQDGTEFVFPVEHGHDPSGILQILLRQEEFDAFPSEQICELLVRMVKSGYDTSSDVISKLFLLTAQISVKHQDAGSLRALQRLLADESTMQKVPPQCFEDMIVYANEHQNYDVQLLLMNAAKRYCSGSSEERFSL